MRNGRCENSHRFRKGTASYCTKMFFWLPLPHLFQLFVSLQSYTDCQAIPSLHCRGTLKNPLFQGSSQFLNLFYAILLASVSESANILIFPPLPPLTSIELIAYENYVQIFTSMLLKNVLAGNCSALLSAQLAYQSISAAEALYCSQWHTTPKFLNSTQRRQLSIQFCPDGFLWVR